MGLWPATYKSYRAPLLISYLTPRLSGILWNASSWSFSRTDFVFCWSRPTNLFNSQTSLSQYLKDFLNSALTVERSAFFTFPPSHSGRSNAILSSVSERLNFLAQPKTNVDKTSCCLAMTAPESPVWISFCLAHRHRWLHGNKIHWTLLDILAGCS